ncbi:DUF4333 domain-containing protein [Modestobacter roseus]|nr:DUF4333 domain-containing protein [Modestobacter roseus]
MGLMLLAVVLLALVVLLTPGFGPTRLDPDAVERDVAAQYQDLRGVPLELRCAEPMPVEAGGSYRCEGTTGDGGPVTVTIEVTSADGAYTWSDE